MSGVAFSELAREESPGLAGLLLAAAGEFREVDEVRSRVELDRMASSLHRWVTDDGLGHADAVAQLLAERRLRPSNRVGPQDAMLDRVLARGQGHPAMLAAICVEAGRRAGLPLAAAGRESDLFVGVRPTHTADGATLLIDPAGELRGPPAGLHWRCDHEVCFLLLSELSRLFCLTGDVANALRAAELRSELPLDPSFHERLASESSALRANLN